MCIFYMIFYITFVKSEHRYEQGLCQDFYYVYQPNSILYTSLEKYRSQSFYIPFQKKFAKIPDVYLNINLLDFSYTFPQGYSLTLTQITTDGFTANVVCESDQRYYGIVFNWFAFSDDRVQVINNFNITSPNSQYTHSYQKKYCKIDVAISNFVSYYAIGTQLNKVTGLSMTSDTVTIQLYTENIKQLGYQILISTSDLFLLGPTIISTQLQGSSQIVDFPPGWQTQNCYINLLGFKRSEADSNIRLKAINTFSSQVTLAIQSWAESSTQLLQHNYYCINDGYFSLVEFVSLMETKYFDAKNLVQTHIEISEINYSQNLMLEEQVTIPNSNQQITFIYYLKCTTNQTLKIQLYCIEDWCKSRQVSCDKNKMNTIRLKSKFKIIADSDQLIKISQTTTSFTAFQKLINQSTFEKVLFKVEIVQ